MKRVAALGALVTALVVAAVTAWVVVLAEPEAPAAAQPAATLDFAPPSVAVAPGLDVDREEVAAFVGALVDDPRGWRADLGDHMLRVVRAGDYDTTPMPGLIGYAYPDVHLVVITDEAWTKVNPRFAALGGTLDDQRTWIVLHELGHLLGHEHTECAEPGPAPIMRAVSYEVGACELNIWPRPELT